MLTRRIISTRNDNSKNWDCGLAITETTPAYWPFMLLGIGGVLFIAGVALGAASSAEVLISVGASNLAMVLALSGSALMIIPIWSLHKKKQLLIYWQSEKIAITALIVAAGYIGTHLGLGQVLTAYFGVAESLGTQAAIGFGFGCLIGLLYWHLRARSSENIPNVVGWETIKQNPAWASTIIIGIGVLCAASTILGPCLTMAMQSAAADMAESIAMETLVAISVASLMPALIWLVNVISKSHAIKLIGSDGSQVGACMM